MGFLNNISFWARGFRSPQTATRLESSYRDCRFEEMEQRRVLSADPVIAGLTYFEGDLGQDTTPDYFEVTFQGGSASTHLTQFTINGDQDGNGGLSDGDMFFDVNAARPGTGGYAGFQLESSRSEGVLAQDILAVRVSSDGLLMTVDVQNFAAGDILAFSADVDEVERYRADKIASGVEFEGSLFDATFGDLHYALADKMVVIENEIDGDYLQEQVSGVFYDEYDELLNAGSQLAGAELVLTYDNETGFADRSAAAIASYDLKPLPISVSGTVFHDEDLDCEQGPQEVGIGGVSIDLQKSSAAGVYETVASTVTDAQGDYEFGYELELSPGNYRLVESQPEGYIDVAAMPGQVGTANVGTVQKNGEQQTNIISNISIELGNTAATHYDFCEVRPTSLSGHVWHDRNDNGTIEVGEEGIANVSIRVIRTGPQENSVDGPFAGFSPVVVQTNGEGYFHAETLPPGVYEVHEINHYPNAQNPLAGYADGKDHIGSVAGQAVGTKTNDRFKQVSLNPGQAGIQYDFGEVRQATISGYVSLTTTEGECVSPLMADHRGIAGVVMEIYTTHQRLVGTTQTDANGFYEFEQLSPGSYSVVQVQPSGYLDAGDHLGKVDGVRSGNDLTNDRFKAIRVASGQQGTMYNFCESVPAEIGGTVWHDINNNGVQEADEAGIAEVAVQLLDDRGHVLGRQLTDANGNYCFADLAAGQYTVREIQPANFMDGKDSLGLVTSDSGTLESVGILDNDQISKIDLRFGDRGDGYNFGEFLPGSLTGFVYHDVDQNCRFDREAQDSPIADVRLELLDHQGAVVATAKTNAGGYYQFNERVPGEYTVREAQPQGYQSVGHRAGWDASDLTAGPGDASIEDVISGITIHSGQHLIQYNFCEISLIDESGGNPFPPEVTPYVNPISWQTRFPGITSYPGLAGSQSGLTFQIASGNGGAFEVQMEQEAYTWHLSVVNAGQPRSVAEATLESNSVWRQVAALKDTDWTRFAMNQGDWTFSKTLAVGDVIQNDQVVQFGMAGGVPVSGDFDGDGIDEIAVFHEGYWLIDINRNGRWDSEDLLAKMGGDSDRPVVGDWDGDGKEDIGIYGPMWANDIEAMSREPGLPNPENTPFTRPKNIPPIVDSASENARIMKLTSFGRQRADLVDHVFGTGTPEDVPVAGDWNGNGIRSIGVFHAGLWHLDVNGDGEFGQADAVFTFGQTGDLPVVGDFNGDGIEEIAVYRAGVWFVDTNGNREMDATDMNFEMGDAGDLPVVGDWDGDGLDEPGLYRGNGPGE